MCLCVCVCVYPSQRLLVTSGVIWTSYDWLNIGIALALMIVVYSRIQPDESMVPLYKSIRYYNINLFRKLM